MCPDVKDVLDAIQICLGHAVAIAVAFVAGDACTIVGAFQAIGGIVEIGARAVVEQVATSLLLIYLIDVTIPADEMHLREYRRACA